MGANFNLNKIILGGRLTADPELKTSPSGVPVCVFTVAVNRRLQKEGEQTADFFNCIAWRGTAEFMAKYFKKSSSICIIGNIHQRTYTDKEGQKKTVTEITVDEALFVDSKGDMPVISSAKEPVMTEIAPNQDLPF